MATKAANTLPLAKKLSKPELAAERKRTAEIKKLKAKIKKLETSAMLPSADDEYFEVLQSIMKNPECRKLRKEVNIFADKIFPVPVNVVLDFSFNFRTLKIEPYDEQYDELKRLTLLPYSSNVRRSPEHKKMQEEATADYTALVVKVNAFIKEFLVQFQPKVLKINKALIDEIAEVVFNIYS